MIPVKTMNGTREDGPDLTALPPLKRGTIFLFLEERSSIAYSYLRKLKDRSAENDATDIDQPVRNGEFTGLVITRQYPPDLTKDQDLGAIPIYWLTTNLRQDQRTISPSAIPRLNLLMNDFIQTPSEGLAIVDCLEYLITQNSFEAVLRLIQAWNDKIVGTKKRLLLSVDPLTLTIQQLHLIKKECQELILQ